MIDRARRDNRGPAELDAELLREVQARPGVRACSCALDCAQATANSKYPVWHMQGQAEPARYVWEAQFV
jgi:hypothetical protein